MCIPTTHNYIADSHQKITLLHHPSLKPRGVAYIAKEIWQARGRQAITVASPLVISVISHSCLSNETQTLSNLSFAQQGHDVIADPAS